MVDLLNNKLYTKYYPLMTMDKHILAIQDKTLELDLLVHKITFHEDEEITIQELNYILELMNKREHEAWITMIGCVLLLILIMFGFYYLIV